MFAIENLQQLLKSDSRYNVSNKFLKVLYVYVYALTCITYRTNFVGKLVMLNISGQRPTALRQHVACKPSHAACGA